MSVRKEKMYFSDSLSKPGITFGKRERDFICKKCNKESKGNVGRKYCDDCSAYIKLAGRG